MLGRFQFCLIIVVGRMLKFSVGSDRKSLSQENNGYFKERTDDGRGGEKQEMCCPKNYASGSQSDIKNSSSNKNNLKSFILCRTERIRD